MAQFNKSTQDFLNQERTLFEVQMIANINGEVVSETNRFPVSIGDTVVSIGNSITANQGTTPWIVSPSGGSTPIAFPDGAVTAFDEPLAVTITPVMQTDAVYGLDPDYWNTTQINNGSVTVNDTGTWSVGCTTDANSYARLSTSRYARYQPGQGMLFRWTAAYTSSTGTGRTTATGIDGIPQVSGPIDREDGYTFGFSGISTARQFGIQHRRGGKVEVRQLTINTAATGIQTATVTLNGVPYTVNLTAAPGGSTAYTATQIAVGLKTTTATQYWQIDSCTSVLTFAYFSPGNVNGTFSFSSSGVGIATGSFTRAVIGASPVDEWIYQDKWDNKTIQFDPTKLNVYAVDFRWLGAGIVRFFMEDPDTGKMTLVHTQHWTKNQTGIYPHITKPSLRLVYRVGSFSGGTASIPVVLRGASIFAGVQGIINQTGSSQGWYNIDSTSRAKDLIWHLLTIQNPYVRNNGILNKSQLVMQSLTVAAQANDPSIIFIVKNAVGTSDLLVFNQIPGHGNPNVFAQYSVSAVTENLALDNLSNVQTLGINGSSTFDLMNYNFMLAPGDTISVFISSSNAISRTSTGITWKVD